MDSPDSRRDNGPAQEPVPEFERVTENNIERTERDILVRVNRSISSLESALAGWDAAKEKPDDLREEYERSRLLHDAIVDWETKMLRSMGERMGFFERVERLREFIRIVERYA